MYTISVMAVNHAATLQADTTTDEYSTKHSAATRREAGEQFQIIISFLWDIGLNKYWKNKNKY